MCLHPSIYCTHRLDLEGMRICIASRRAAKGRVEGREGVVQNTCHSPQVETEIGQHGSLDLITLPYVDPTTGKVRTNCRRAFEWRAIAVAIAIVGRIEEKEE